MALRAPKRIASQLGVSDRAPMVMFRHHDSHAYCSYALSPFVDSDAPTMITVIDGYGDDCSVSLYVGRAGRVEQIRNNVTRSVLKALEDILELCKRRTACRRPAR